MYQVLATRIIASSRLIQNNNRKETDIITNAVYQQLLASYNTHQQEDAYILTKLDYLKWKKSLSSFQSNDKSDSNELPQNGYVIGLDSFLTAFPHKLLCAEVYFPQQTMLRIKIKHLLPYTSVMMHD